MIVCADDYGLRDDIDSAILELAVARRLSAVSCLVALERCSPQHLIPLLKLQPQIDLGLHLCFTDEKLPLSAGADASSMPLMLFPSFSTILRAALGGRIKPKDATTQIAWQYDLFTQKCGRPPDFIDGHLHVHQLPGIKEGLLRFLASLPPQRRPYIRNTSISLLNTWRQRLPWLKALSIGFFGARLRVQLRRHSYPTNDGFSGVYNFENYANYTGYLRGFIACLGQPNGILVVHPGREENWRRQELTALLEFSFPEGSPNRFQR